MRVYKRTWKVKEMKTIRWSEAMRNKKLQLALIVTFFVFIVLGHLVLTEQSQGKPLPSTEPLIVKIINEPTPEPWYLKLINALMPFLLVIGGAAGSAFVFYLQYKSTRRIRMDQVLAERKIKADGEAYSRMKTIQAYFFTDNYALILNEMMQQQNWLLDNRLFLPGTFVDKWMTIRNRIEEGLRLKNISDEVKEGLSNKIGEAIGEIYEDVGMREIKIEPLDPDKKGGREK